MGVSNRIFAVLILGSSAVGCAPQGAGGGSAVAQDVTSPSQSGSSSSSSGSNSSSSSAPVVVPARASTAANIKVCPTSATAVVPGADVSNYDPGTNWTTFQHAGNGFAFVKASEGISLTNALFTTDWPAIRAAGVLRGAYHFFHPGDDPLAQAQLYLKVIGAWDLQDLPPMLDWEVSDGVAVATQIANAKLWLQAVESATGRIPIIYVDPSFFNSLGNPQGFQRYPLFIANYGASCPSIPPPWSTWTFWQKNIGAVSGVATNPADIDEFNGSAAELANFVSTESVD